MAIRMLGKGEIKCDACGKQIATLKTTANFLKMAEEEARWTEIRCIDCSENPIPESLDLIGETKQV